MAPKLILWDKVNTIPNWWEPLGPILGHFGPFRRDFRPQSKIAGPDWSLFLTRLAAKNDFNGPKTDTVGQGNYHTGLVGAFGAHFGPLWKPFRSDFRDQSKIVGPIWSLFLTRLAAKNDFNGPKTDTVGQGNYHTGLVGAFGAHFGVILGPRAR